MLVEDRITQKVNTSCAQKIVSKIKSSSFSNISGVNLRRVASLPCLKVCVSCVFEFFIILGDTVGIMCAMYHHPR